MPKQGPVLSYLTLNTLTDFTGTLYYWLIHTINRFWTHFSVFPISASGYNAIEFMWSSTGVTVHQILDSGSAVFLDPETILIPSFLAPSLFFQTRHIQFLVFILVVCIHWIVELSLLMYSKDFHFTQVISFHKPVVFYKTFVGRLLRDHFNTIVSWKDNLVSIHPRINILISSIHVVSIDTLQMKWKMWLIISAQHAKQT